MDAILLELERDKGRVQHPSEPSASRGGSQNTARKKGSFVDDGDEHITTNIFVGNLAPSITEEQMTELFRQFGENDTMISVMMTVYHSGRLCDD
jgi:U2-associated protein SR140